jgi:hypothetical protein
MLAVTLFLYGMATTVKTQRIKVLFTTVGSAVALVAVVWAVVLFAKPVKDLRQCMTDDGTPAIDAYAQGVGLAYQDLYEEAIVQFDAALPANRSMSTRCANALMRMPHWATGKPHRLITWPRRSLVIKPQTRPATWPGTTT